MHYYNCIDCYRNTHVCWNTDNNGIIVNNVSGKQLRFVKYTYKFTDFSTRIDTFEDEQGNEFRFQLRMIELYHKDRLVMLPLNIHAQLFLNFLNN